MEITRVCVLLAFFAIGNTIAPSPLPEVCLPMVPEKCQNDSVVESCPTCCCETSANVEFYDPDRPEPECTALPAVYIVTYTGTWSNDCQPDYYVPDAHWSPPTMAAHNPDYRVWDACMDNVTLGVALVSQTGSTDQIRKEYEMAGKTILATSQGQVIMSGVGDTSARLAVSKDYQWVSVISMLAPSLDRMVGVAGLRLCNGSVWRDYAKVCTELFSTATKSERVSPQMERNSVQYNNCSFGYFEFTLSDAESAGGIAGTFSIVAVMLFATAAIFQFF